MTKRLGSVVLGSQALVLVFAAVGGRAVAASTGAGDGTVALVAGLALTVFAIVAAAAMRSRLGVWLGWAVQLGTFAYALVTPAMLAVGVLFTALWLIAIRKGRQMDALTDSWHASQESGAAPQPTPGA